jgi:hypothetical protein
MCLDIFNGGPNNNQPHLAKLRQPLGSALDIDENRQARGERDQN